VTRIAAHRGASRARRENTIEAFLAAGEMGAHMVELDVRRTADRVLVVHHDPIIDGTGAIMDLTASRLPSHVPSLDEALDACAGMEVNVEIKSDRKEIDYDPHQWAAGAVVELLRARGDADRMLVSSFDMATIDAVHARAPDIRTGFLYVMTRRLPAAQVARVAGAGHVAIHPHHRTVTKALVAAAHASNISVNVWTVDEPARMRALAAMGVDTIITNVPDVGLATLGA
jgi:glycerophosphoryl diester phosphodiesterase